MFIPNIYDDHAKSGVEWIKRYEYGTSSGECSLCSKAQLDLLQLLDNNLLKNKKNTETVVNIYEQMSTIRQNILEQTQKQKNESLLLNWFYILQTLIKDKVLIVSKPYYKKFITIYPNSTITFASKIRSFDGYKIVTRHKLNDNIILSARDNMGLTKNPNAIIEPIKMDWLLEIGHEDQSEDDFELTLKSFVSLVNHDRVVMLQNWFFHRLIALNNSPIKENHTVYYRTEMHPFQFMGYQVYVRYLSQLKNKLDKDA